MRTLFFAFLFFTSAGAFAQSLVGTGWLLKSIDNIETGRSMVVENDAKISLLFDSDSVYSGYGCNRYEGRYRSENGKTLIFQKANGVIHPTCLGLGTLEKELLEIYLKATRYRLDKEKLFIFTSDDRRLVFVKQ